jgi:SAM-dependent methyltransferase
MVRERQGGARANYGLDAPSLVRAFLIIGPTLILGGLATLALGASGVIGVLATTVLISGAICFIEGLLMVWSSYVGKLRARDRLLDALRLRGDEQVLDVGCGRGLLLLGAARRLPRGRALGIDLWSQEDLGDNRREATLANAQAEGVGDRVEVQSGDMRTMPFPDASFDAVVANLSIHNIYDREGRRQAIGEIVRVLKPGGQVALMDFRHVPEYAEDLRAAGMQAVHVSGLSFWIFPPVRTATGKK